MLPPIKRQLEGIMPYEAPYITEGIKLDANESTAPLEEGLRTHLLEWVQTMPLNYYPDTCNTRLREAIAQAYQVSLKQIICGVGSDQLIDCILRTFVEKDGVVLAPDPSFSMYRLTTQVNGGQFLVTPLQEDFSYDMPAMIACVVAHQPQVVFICNPNNPTGTTVSKEKVETLVKVAKGIVIIDEAYAEFHEEDMVALALKYPHVIVLRTFSKAYGLAGARIGYGIASEALIKQLDAVRPPYNINVFSQEAATYVMSNRHLYAPKIAAIKEARETMRKALGELGFQVAPSGSNFLWFEVPDTFASKLQEAGIYVRTFKYQAKDYCRLTIGTPEQNKRVLEVLRGDATRQGGASDATSQKNT